MNHADGVAGQSEAHVPELRSRCMVASNIGAPVAVSER
jgi:hypothetical protein